METMPISKFKATCLAVIENVRQTRQPVLVTRRGQPMAEIQPPRPSKSKHDWWGEWAPHVKFIGDIISPAVDESEIEVLRDTQPLLRPGARPPRAGKRPARRSPSPAARARK